LFGSLSLGVLSPSSPINQYPFPPDPTFSSTSRSPTRLFVVACQHKQTKQPRHRDVIVGAFNHRLPSKAHSPGGSSLRRDSRSCAVGQHRLILSRQTSLQLQREAASLIKPKHHPHSLPRPSLHLQIPVLGVANIVAPYVSTVALTERPSHLSLVLWRRLSQ